jgi:hypothetical protein
MLWSRFGPAFALDDVDKAMPPTTRLASQRTKQLTLSAKLMYMKTRLLCFRRTRLAENEK